MTTTARPRLLLIDGHSMAYRAYFALPVEKFSTTTGQSTNAVFGFTSMLTNLLRDEKPTHVAVAFDAGERRSGPRSCPATRARATRAPSPSRGRCR
ncbi:hypothetical protein NKG05_28960 [Oerskovia sp. M15]